MASTVNIAFEEFLKDSVRLDSNQVTTAQLSRDNLLTNLNGFSGDDDFFMLLPECHLKYGSFARKTKIRPLDDIDLMICISAQGRKYSQYGDTYYISGLDSDDTNGLISLNSHTLNSTKVINRFLKKLGNLNDYSKAEMHKNQEAATLKLKSYDWNFDIVPCWHMDIDKYLIPDGSGNWKLTDPRIDNKRIIDINKKHKGIVLDVIRIMKYWNNRKITYTIGSYLLETMILEAYENKAEKDVYWVDIEFRDLLGYLSNMILGSIPDPKGIQGELNTFSFTERSTISVAMREAYKKACEATSLEIKDNDQKAAILKWGEVLGKAFPGFS